MKLYEVSQGVCNYYRKHVKGNQEVSDVEVQKKLTRNINMTKVTVPLSNNRVIYLYGNLHITVKGNKIIKLKNNKQPTDWFYKDRKKFNELNQMLGLKSETKPYEVGDLSYIDEYAQGFKLSF